MSILDANESTETTQWLGGDCFAMVEGTWDTATVVAQIYSNETSTWITVHTWTSDGTYILHLPVGSIRFTMSSVGGSSSVSAVFRPAIRS